MHRNLFIIPVISLIIEFIINVKLITFDTTNQYKEHIANEKINRVPTTFKQIYFSHEGIIYKQDDRILVINPISAILSEIYLQDIKNTHYRKIINGH